MNLKGVNTMKKMSIGLKQVIVLIMLLMMTTVSCFVLSGCDETDDPNGEVQIEEEEVVEGEPDDLEP